jgi:hypothetical protein
MGEATSALSAALQARRLIDTMVSDLQKPPAVPKNRK